jgi:hypothetical protein
MPPTLKYRFSAANTMTGGSIITTALQRNEAMSLRAADAARTLLSTRPRDAAALALAAYRVAPTAESHDMLITAHAAAGASFLVMGYVTVPGRVAVTTEQGAGDAPASQQLRRPDGGSWLPAASLPVGSDLLSLMSAGRSTGPARPTSSGTSPTRSGRTRSRCRRRFRCRPAWTAPAMWRLDSDLPRVIRETCAAPAAVDWERYFPGAARPRLCPPPA